MAIALFVVKMKDPSTKDLQLTEFPKSRSSKKSLQNISRLVENHSEIDHSKLHRRAMDRESTENISPIMKGSPDGAEFRSDNRQVDLRETIDAIRHLREAGMDDADELESLLLAAAATPESEDDAIFARRYHRARIRHAKVSVSNEDFPSTP